MATEPAGDRSGLRRRDGEPPLERLDRGTTVLVSGPPLVGKYDLILEALGAGTRQGDGAIVVSTRDDERDVVDDLERVSPGMDRSLVGVVDCVSGDDRRSAGDASYDGQVRVHRAGSPADLTGIGIGASELIEELHADGATGVRLGVDSLSTLLLYADFDRLARFLHVLAGRVDQANGVGLFAVNPNTMESAQFDQLTTMLDGLVELREGEDRREVQVRIRGIPGVEDRWETYTLPAE